MVPSLLALVLITAAAARQPAQEPKYPHDVHFDFRGKPLPSELSVTPKGSERFIRTEAEGLRITLPKQRDDLSPVSFSTRVGAQGDFDITAAFEVLEAESPADGFGVGPSLFISRADPPHHGATLGRRWRPGSKQVIFWDQALGKVGEQPQFDLAYRLNTETQFRLRLKRMGSELHYLVGKGLEGSDFSELPSKDFGPSDINEVSVKVSTGNQPCRLDVRLVELRIRSGATPTAVRAAPAVEHSRLWLVGALLVALAIAFVILAAVVARRKRDGDAAVAFACPGCGQRLATQEAVAGKSVTCPECGTMVRFPVAGGTP